MPTPNQPNQQSSRIPLYPPEERSSNTTTNHYHLGDIGAGKTVATQTLARSFPEQSPILVVDPLSTKSWRHLAKHTLTNITYLTNPSSAELSTALKHHTTTTESLIVFESAYWMQSQHPTLYRQFLADEFPHTTVHHHLHEVPDLPDPLPDTDVLHLYATSNLFEYFHDLKNRFPEEHQTHFNNIGQSTLIGIDKPIGDTPPTVYTFNNATRTYTKSTHELTPTEKELLI